MVALGALEVLLGGARLSVPLGVLGILTMAVTRIPRLYENLHYAAALSGTIAVVLTSHGVDAVAVALTLALLLPSDAIVPCVVAAIAFRSDWHVALLVISAAGIGQFQYRRLLRRSKADVELIRSTQDLRMEQARALSADHAASLERLAAAISHELNSPVGAMRSSAQTLQTVARKFVGATEEERKRVAGIHDELTKLLLSSTERVQTIVARLQRLTSLDRALVRPTDVNGILRDLAATIESEVSSGVSIRLNLHNVPTVICETQAWTTILNRLICAAAERDHTRVDISTAFADEHVVVDIVEIGHEVKTLDLAFTEMNGRIGATNWTLFQVRSWVQQQGGDLRQFCDLEGCLTTRVMIPSKV